MDTVKEYVMKFGDFPPLVQTMDYNDDFYTALMEEAIKKNEPLTIEIINNELAKEEFDLVLDDNDVDAREYAKRNAK